MRERTRAVDHDRRVRVGTRFPRGGGGCFYILRLVVWPTICAAENDMYVLISACPHDRGETLSPVQSESWLASTQTRTLFRDT